VYAWLQVPRRPAQPGVFMKASYLGKVIEYFNPMQSLDEKHKAWYVERPDNPHDEIKVLLLNDPTPLKILFSGHIGSGKSSALNRLVIDAEIKQKFFIVQFSVERDLNIFDLTYSDPFRPAAGYRQAPL
jgi:hypothetical protein